MNYNAQVLGFRIGAILGPILVLLGFQILTFEPASAHASSSSLEFLPLPTVPQQTGEPDEQARSIRESSPFWYEEAEHSLPEMPMTMLPEKPMEDPDPVFVLSAVLPSTNKSFAVINGKPHAEGDVIVEGWTLVKISGKDRYIIVKHTSGRRLRVTMSRN